MLKEYKEIVLSNGNVTKVDIEDYHFLCRWKWKQHTGGYACRSAGSPKQGYSCVLMHRIVANTPVGMETDHINGDKLDNRKFNLRNVNKSENEYNKTVTKRNTSGINGRGAWECNPYVWCYTFRLIS